MPAIHLYYQLEVSLSEKPVRRSIARYAKQGTLRIIGRPRYSGFSAQHPIEKHRVRYTPLLANFAHIVVPVELITCYQASSDIEYISVLVIADLDEKHSPNFQR